MALVVEDGTGKSDAESYISVTDSDTYHDNRGNTDWTGATAVKEASSRRGAQFLDGRFLGRLKGEKSSSGQALQWPRDYVTDEDGNEVASTAIPTRLEQACAEASRLVPYTQEITEPSDLASLKAGSVGVDFAVAYHQRGILDVIDELMKPYVKSSRTVRA